VRRARKAKMQKETDDSGQHTVRAWAPSEDLIKPLISRRGSTAREVK
jgi:hypothetical protein